MIRKLLVLVLLVSTAQAQPEKRYFVFEGFGMPLVQCQLINNQARNCHYLSTANLDGVMEAIHRATARRGYEESSLALGRDKR